MLSTVGEAFTVFFAGVVFVAHQSTSIFDFWFSHSPQESAVKPPHHVTRRHEEQIIE